MERGKPAPRLIRKFGVFEFDESSGELRRNGVLVHLPPQPFQILKLLIDHTGEIVHRDRIRQEIWSGTAVDFDRSLNVAIAQIRSVLNDDAANPRFVQTIPRRGYRFLAKVDRDPPDGGVAPETARIPGRLGRLGWAIGLGVAAMLGAGAFRYWHGAAGPVRIAVLPFYTGALEPADALWSEGVFDDLLTALGGTQPQRIEVIGRGSVSHLSTGQLGSLREAGKRLNVSYILESSLRREGGSLHLAARLVDSSTEAVRWSATFVQDGSPQPFAETVVGRVSAGVLTALFPSASPAIGVAICGDGEDAYRTGRMLVNRGGLTDLEKSLPFFQKAPCSEAAAEEAEVLVRLARLRRPSGDWDAARVAARTALASNSGLARAHLAFGNIAFWHDWNWPAAQHEFQEALRIDPSDPDAHHDMAWLQIALRMRGDARSSLETAIALDPLSARTRMDSAWLFLQLGEFGRAANEARRALVLDPNMAEARFCVSRALLYAGDIRSAAEAIGPVLPPSLVRATAALPPTDAMRRLIEFHSANAKTDPYQRAWQLAFLSSPSEALTALEEGFTERNPMMPMIAADSAFRSLRTEPRFRRLISRMGL